MSVKALIAMSAATMTWMEAMDSGDWSKAVSKEDMAALEEDVRREAAENEAADERRRQQAEPLLSAVSASAKYQIYVDIYDHNEKRGTPISPREQQHLDRLLADAYVEEVHAGIDAGRMRRRRQHEGDDHGHADSASVEEPAADP